LGVGESIIVDTGYLAAMTETCTMDIEQVKGAKNIFFGGEGLFHTKVTGPGKVYIQSMPIWQIAQELIPYMPTPSTSNDNGFTIKQSSLDGKVLDHVTYTPGKPAQVHQTGYKPYPGK
jgi:hypothetical protein